MKKTKFLFLSLVLVIVSQTIKAQDNRIGRYLTVEPVAEEAARFPLAQVSNITIPAEVTSIREALAVVLAETGYSLAPDSVLDPESLTMFSSPVAASQRVMSKVTPLNAMTALTGPGFEVVVDPLSRRIAIDVCLHMPESINQVMGKTE